MLMLGIGVGRVLRLLDMSTLIIDSAAIVTATDSSLCPYMPLLDIDVVNHIANTTVWRKSNVT